MSGEKEARRLVEEQNLSEYDEAWDKAIELDEIKTQIKEWENKKADTVTQQNQKDKKLKELHRKKEKLDQWFSRQSTIRQKGPTRLTKLIENTFLDLLRDNKRLPSHEEVYAALDRSVGKGIIEGKNEKEILWRTKKGDLRENAYKTFKNTVSALRTKYGLTSSPK